MKCVVCGKEMGFYFTKEFNAWGLGTAEYWRCANCGLVICKTLYDMSQRDWRLLNDCYHNSLFKLAVDDPRRPMRLRGRERLCRQADTIGALTRKGLIPIDRQWIDHGCGNGVLAEALASRGLPVIKYDPYLGYSPEGVLEKQYGLVISTAVFEHLRERAVYDEIAGLVADNGVLALHVLVRESIPQDPTWFYLLPVHCTFFTNKSMQLLFDQWGFEASLYHVPSRMWFWFKKDVEPIGGFHYKRGFMDYWS